jgi:2-dehydro-3-deoxy-D-gluconate 5-dehydrogenase
MSVADLFDLHGRTALVTGGGTGIGRAIALTLAAAGADLLLLSERDNVGETRAAAQAFGRVVGCVTADLGDLDALPGAVEEALRDRPVDILVNNAGIIRRGPAVSISSADWDAVLDVNLKAAFRLAQLVGAPMLDAGRGKVINLASLLSFQGGIDAASYTASKHGVAGLTRVLANEWAAAGVQVNAIAPGYIATDVTAALRASDARSAEILSRIPAGRWGDPDDVAGAALFLASAAADYVNGHVLVVDGGWLAR